jgi:hypothetical protein
MEVLKSGRQQLTTDRNHIQLDYEKEKPILRISPCKADVAWFQIAEIILYPKQAEPYLGNLIKKLSLES